MPDLGNIAQLPVPLIAEEYWCGRHPWDWCHALVTSEGIAAGAGRCDVHFVCAEREPEFLHGARANLSSLPWPADGGR